jgi:hypothetical protein
MFLRALSRLFLMLSWNGREITSDLSERKALEKYVKLDESWRVSWTRCAVCVILSGRRLGTVTFVRVVSEAGGRWCG